jgi:hypothetical protein
MGTKSNRSSGTQFTPKGVNQGTVLVDPKSGTPIDTIVDVDGKKRLAVDANVSISGISVNISLDAASDSVRIQDPDTGAHIKVHPDGSIDSNVVVDANNDNITVGGTEDGLFSGTKHALKIGSDLKLEVKDTAADSSLASIDSKLNTLGQKAKVGSVPVVLASDQDPLPIDIESFSATPDNILAVGTEDGTKTGTKHVVKVGSDNKLEVKDTIAASSLVSIDTKLDSQATAVLQTSTNTKLDTLHSDFLVVEGKQDTNNTKLDTIHTDLVTVNSKLNTLGQKTSVASVPVVLASDQSPLPIDIDAFSATPDNIMIVGTEDGSKTGIKRGVVNNLKQQILATHNRTQNITYADFGTKDQRVTQIDYQSATFPGVTARKILSYTLVGNKYRRDSINWTVV